MKKEHILIIILIFIAVITYFIITKSQEPPVLGDVHKHADFKVYINGEAYNFSQEKYMSSKNKTLSNFIHLHDMDGTIIHQHMSTITLGQFFQSLEMKFNETCFVLDNGTSYCNNQEKTLKFYVNGKINHQFGKYEFNDLDRILISYGSEDESIINKQIESVTDNGCIQSKKCPEKGEPGDESSCATGDEKCLEVTGHG